MNNQSPLVPLGSLLEQKNKGRTRVKIAVSFVLVIHGIGLLALLVQGCHKDEPTTQKAEQGAGNTAALPTLDTTNNVAETPQPPAAGQGAATGDVAKTPETPAIPASGGTDYSIAKGDTYGTIASHYHVSVKALEEANPGVDEKRLQIGKKIHIPAQPLPSATVATSNPGTTTEGTNGEKLYTVKSGDMLITIAKAQGSTVKAIRAANNLTSDNIKVGQKLKIPAKVVETAASNAPASR